MFSSMLPYTKVVLTSISEVLDKRATNRDDCNNSLEEDSENVSLKSSISLWENLLPQV